MQKTAQCRCIAQQIIVSHIILAAITQVEGKTTVAIKSLHVPLSFQNQPLSSAVYGHPANCLKDIGTYIYLLIILLSQMD